MVRVMEEREMKINEKKGSRMTIDSGRGESRREKKEGKKRGRRHSTHEEDEGRRARKGVQ